MKLQEIAERLGCRLEGDGTIEISGVAALEDAEPGQLTFFANPRYTAELKRTRASAVIAAETVDAVHAAVLRTRDPYLTFAHAVALFADSWRPPRGVHRLALVEDGAAVAGDASIGPFVVVGAGASVGARTVVFGHVTIGRRAVIGDDCVIGHIVHLEGCTIHDRALVGNGAIVLHRVQVESGAIVGANAVVLDDTVVPAGALAVGAPATIKPGRVNPELTSIAARSYVDRAASFRL